MKPKLIPSLLILCFLFSNAPLVAQSELNKSTDLPQIERDEIVYNAAQTIRRLNRFYYSITDSRLSPLQIKQAIEESVVPGGANQIFYSSGVIIENDLNPSQNNYFDSEKKQVKEYLQDLDFLYQKNAKPSIKINNLTVSQVKKTDYYFVRVVYDKVLEGKHRNIQTPYPGLQRVATVIAEKSGNHWKTYISNISFHDISFPIDDTKHNLPYLPGREKLSFTPSPIFDTLVHRIKFIRPTYIDSITRAQTDSLRINERKLAKLEIQEGCDYYINEGDKAHNQKQWETALAYYYRANAYECNRAKVGQKIKDVERIINLEASLDRKPVNFGQKALNYQKAGNYVKAIEFYRKSAKGSLGAFTINEKISEMEKVVSNLNKAEAECGKNLRGCLTLLSNLVLQFPEEPHYYRARGEIFFKRGQEDRAVTDLKQTLKLRPQDVRASKMLGEIAINQAKSLEDEKKKAILLQEAITHYSTAVKWGDSTESDLYRRAYLYSLFPGKLNEAIKDYQTILMSNKQAYKAYMLRGKLHMSRQEWLKAKFNFDLAGEINPEAAETYYFRGICQIKTGHITTANDFFTQARNLRMERNQSLFLNREAQKYYDLAQRENGDEAIRLLTYAITINPEMHEAWAERGEELQKQHRYWEAIRDFSQAIIYDRQYARYLYLRGLAHQGNWQFKASIRDFNQATEYDNNIQYFLQLGDTHYLLSNFNESLNAYLDGLAIAPDNAFLLYKSGKAFYRARDYANARNAFTNALSAEEKITGALKSAVYYYRGNANFEMGEYRKAMKDFLAAEEDSHKPGRVYAAYGDVHFAYRDYDKAGTNYVTSLTMGHVDPQRITHQLGKISMARENYSEAIEQLTTCLEKPGELSFFTSGEERNKGPELYEAEIKRDLGLAYLYKGDLPPAIKRLKEALDTNPQDGLAHYGMACLLALEDNINDHTVEKIIAHLKLALSSQQVNQYFLKQSSYFNSIKKEETYKELFREN